MAKITKKLDIALKDADWKDWKKMTNKSSCSKFKDPSEVFLLGVKTICNSY